MSDRPIRLLFVDRGRSRVDAALELLRGAGFDPAWERVETAPEMAAALDAGRWDLALSDYSLPEFGAEGALDLIRERGVDLPLVVVADPVGEERVAGVILSGARDFVLRHDLRRLVPVVEREVEAVEARRAAAESLRGGEGSPGLAEAPAEDRHRLLLDTIPHIVWITDADGAIDYLNRRGRERLETTADRFAGRRWLDLVHPEDRERAREAWESVVESGATYRDEYRVREPDGSYRWYLSLAASVREPDGTVRLRVGTWTDIDVLKRTEEELRASELRLRQIADNIEEVFWLAEPGTARRIVYVNPAYETIWGRSRERLYEGPEEEWLEAIHPEDRDRVEEALRTRQASGEYDEVYRIERPDGEIRWIRDRAFPVRNRSGEVVRVTGVADDVTDRRRLEEGLRRAQKIEAIGLLAGGIAHDFNNVLTAIRGNAEMALAVSDPDSPAREELESVLAAARSATTLTRQLLTFSRRKIVEPRPVSLTAVTEEMEPMIRRLVPSTIALEIEPGEAPAVTVVDPGHLEQIVMNLVVNARDAMPMGGTLSVRVLRESGWVGIAVEDTGVGMDERLLERVFEPLFTTKTSGEGTGLGLFIVRGIVDDLGGRIEVGSEPGRGTTFRFWLPAAGNGVDVSPEPGAEEAEDAGGGETILLVEDDVSVARLAERILTQKGYVVEVATDGVAALERVRSGGVKPDLVMTDVVMPRMSGPELADRLEEAGIDVPLLFTSGYPSSGAAARGPVPERARFIEKPFSPKELTREVRRMLDARREKDRE